MFESLPLWAAVGFYPADRLPEGARPEKKQILDQVLSASRKIFFRASRIDPNAKDLSRIGDFCSGQFISNDGYFLTAAHCLDNALLTDSVRETVGASLRNEGKIRWAQFATQVPSPRLIIQDVMLVSAYGETTRTSAELVLVGSGFLLEPDSENASPESAQIYTHDYAILKFYDLPRTACVALTSKGVEIGQDVLHVGYPAKIKRPEQLSSDGNSAYFGYGKVLRGYEDLQLSRDQPSEVIARYNLVYSSATTFPASIDAVHGSSGGMVVSRSGRLLGILAANLSDPSIDYMDQETFSGVVRAPVIRREAGQLLGREKAAEAFRCELEIEKD